MDHEYYQSIYSWFERCGIISEIRTQLRHKLVHAFKNNEPLWNKNSAPKSAKQYVYDLLIAEYLLNHNYAYTLSVFVSEAPLLANFHKATCDKSEDKENNKEKFKSDYIVHSLETLGINPKDSKGQYIISQYIENDIPLLLSIFKCISEFPFDMHASMQQSSVRNKQTQTEFSESYDMQKLTAMKQKIIKQKLVFDNKLREREVMLKEQAIVMEEQLTSLNKKLEQAQSIMQHISMKETQLKEKRQNEEQQILHKEIELAQKEKLLLEETNRKLVQDLQTLQQELSKMQIEHRPAKPETTSIVKNMEVQTDVEAILKAEELQTLTKEKEELTILVKEQQQRIEQITQRALQLSRQIEDTRLLKPVTETPNQVQHTVISESSSTEDILQDAKLRLKRLEEESLKADQHYYNFINTSS